MAKSEVQQNATGTKNLVFMKVGSGKGSKQVFMLKVPEATAKEKTLADLQTLVKDNKLTKEYSKLPFCSAQGAVVDNDWNINEYLSEVNTENTDDSAQPKDENPKATDDSVQPKDENPKDTPVDSSKSSKGIKVYLKRKSEWSKGPGFEISNPDLKLPDIPKYMELPERKAPESSIIKGDWKAVKNSDKNPQQLGQTEWRVATINNALCYGLSVLRQDTGKGKGTPVGLIRAPYPAFRLKERKLFDAADTTEPTIQVPDFIVDDQSYVSIYETKTQFQSSLSKSSINEVDISGSIGLPAFGGVLGFGGGVKHSREEQTKTDESRELSQMNISYNFPRVTLRLDEYSLEVTQQCQQALKEAVEENKADRFLEQFGEYFSTQVQLGGRLLASEEFDSSITTSASDVKNALKVQASLSFKKPSSAGVSAGFDWGSGDGTQNHTTNSHTDSTLQWQANGGDTLLANSPPDWCPTVAPFQNWRIINRAGNRHILNLIAKFKDPKDITEKVKKLMTEETTDPTLPNQQKPLLPPRQGRMFYLRRSPQGDWKYNKYLLAYQKEATEWKKDDISALSKTSKDLPEESGTAIIRKSLDDCNKYGCYLEFQAPDGNGMTKIMYGQPYKLRNPSTGLYFCLKTAPGKEDADSLLVAKDEDPSSQSAPLESNYWFVRGSDGTDRGEVKQDDTVTIRWGKESGNSSSILTLFHETNYSGLVKGSRSLGKDDELKLTMMFKDVWEKTA